MSFVGEAVYNSGHLFLQKIYSDHGLLTTVAYQFGPASAPTYALEGYVSVGSEALSWLKKNLNVFDDISDLHHIASTASNELYFVPAFRGLNAPHWKPDARRFVFGLIFTSFPDDLRVNCAVLLSNHEIHLLFDLGMMRKWCIRVHIFSRLVPNGDVNEIFLSISQF